MALVNDRWYCTLQDLKAELGETGTDNDARLSRYIAQASRAFEDATGRNFVPVTATKYLDCPLRDANRLFLAYEDLLTLTTLTDQTGTITSTYYWLYPLNMKPYHSIVLNTTTLGRCFEYNDDPNNAISALGQWGFCDDYMATGLTLAAAISSTTATTVTLSGAGCKAGWTLLVDTEAMHVSAVTGNVATVQRGANGTTAATHLISTAVYRYAVPQEIEIAVLELASYTNNTRTSGGVESESIGEYSVKYDISRRGWPAGVVNTIKRYQRIGV